MIRIRAKTVRRIGTGTLVAIVAAVLLMMAWPIGHILLAGYSEPTEAPPGPPEGHIDDASRLNETVPARVFVVPKGEEEAMAVLREALTLAETEDLRVSIGGARHSMGGQSLLADGIFVDMSGHDHIEVDEAAKEMTVGAGATWAQIIPVLHDKGLSPLVMQSNNDFSIGGTVSVNAHGWQHGMPPVASTVRSFTLMTADGTLVRCSRTENPELFALALGGYGGFGILVDITMEVTDNAWLRSEQWVGSSEDLLEAWTERTDDPDINMAYGRVHVGPTGFLEQSRLTTYHRVDGDKPIPPLKQSKFPVLKRAVFRSSMGSGYGKDLRWRLEKAVGGESGGTVVRTTLQNGPAAVYSNRFPEKTDILHEYFVPPDGFVPFLEAMKEIVPRHGADLLNITVRHVAADTDTVLTYAPDERYALVMLFDQTRDDAGEASMKAFTRDMIDAVLDVGGTYYLPYRLHGTPEQLRRGYPMFDRVLAARQRADPNGRFSNTFWQTYGRR